MLGLGGIFALQSAFASLDLSPRSGKVLGRRRIPVGKGFSADSVAEIGSKTEPAPTSNPYNLKTKE